VSAAGIRVEPDDEANRALVAQVHPADWPNPEPRGRYQLVVIGAGTAGLVSASIAAGLGARVALIERHLMGGDCLNVGCVPSKAMLAAARSWHSADASAASFGGPAVAGPGRFAAVMARMRRLRAGLSPLDGAARFRDLGVDVFFGHARFTASDALTVDGRRLEFKRAVIATGARPAVPAVPGLEGTDYLTNESVFGLTEAPGHLLVLGAGPVGCELAQAFARLGSQVTLVNRAGRILPREETEAAAVVQRALAADGVRLLADTRAVRAERRGPAVVLHLEGPGAEPTLQGDALLVAVGRAPNVDDLGLDLAGVAYGPSGIVVNDRLRTSNRAVFAIGDVSSAHRYTHVADAQARLAVPNALFFGIGGGRASRLVVPRVTYTAPELAQVGLSPAEAASAGIAVDTVTVPLGTVDRAVLDGVEDGLLRIHLRRGSDRILGATLVADHAGELIAEIALAITAGVGLGRVGQTIHPYPTQGEVFRKAADAWRRTRLTPRARTILRTYFRWLG
jgi:pyruvate/2-oxoglutarate dehydrogenase complex dihydrolipoamide dehydrogenase (E3) component